jgi:hypothetical protein
MPRASRSKSASSRTGSSRAGSSSGRGRTATAKARGKPRGGRGRSASQEHPHDDATAKKQARQAKKEGKAPTTQSSAFVHEEMHRMKVGEGGLARAARGLVSPTRVTRRSMLRRAHAGGKAQHQEPEASYRHRPQQSEARRHRCARQAKQQGPRTQQQLER